MDNKRHVFIVDDIIENIEVLQDLLEQENIKVSTAQSGMDALQAIPKKTPDLVLLDLFMPEMDGLEVCKKLKSNKKTTDIPIIFLTAGSEIDFIIQGFDAGAVDYITKPFNPNELITRVNTHIELKKTKEELRDTNRKLEKRVAERTKQISKFNEELLKEIESHKHTMRSLQKSEYLLKEAQKISKLGHWHLNLVENKLIWSDEVYRIFEIDPKEFGADYEAFLDLIHPEDREQVNNLYMNSVHDKTEYNINHRILLKDGRIKHVNERCKTEYNEIGEATSSTGIIMDITSQKQTEQRVLNTKHLAEEKERSRIAKDLHDGVSPLLAAIKLFTQSLRKQTDLNKKAKLHVQIEETINDAITSISEISNNLSPHILHNFGIGEAIEHYITRISKSHNIKVSFSHNLCERIDENIELTVYRVAVELINNGLKHSQATEMTINIDKQTNLILHYYDNGTGFNYRKVLKEKKGMGLYNIINRIESLDGHITFAVDQGLHIKIDIPYISNN